MRSITIDTGTTNTRVKLWHGGQVIAQSCAEVGVRDTAISGSRDKLQAGVRNAIQMVLTEAAIELQQVEVMVASGMITSDFGLHEVPHVEAPAGIEELARAVVQKLIPEVVDRPMWFVPGIKNSLPEVDLTNYEAMDIMRGEEVEAFGLIEVMKLHGPAVFVLPGSHSKFITIDERNRITGCVTTLAGELLDVITSHTILAGSVSNSFAHELDEKMLHEGARCCSSVGLGRACFSARILDLFGNTQPEQRANFLLGAVLAEDLLALKRSKAIRLRPEIPVVISGKKVMKQAFAELIRHDPFFRGEVLVVDDAVAADLAGLGSLAVVRERGLMSGSSVMTK